MKRILFTLCLAALGGMFSTSFAQGDSSNCYLQTWFVTGANPNGVPTYTAQASGIGSQTQFYWLVNGSMVGSQSSYTAQLAPGTELCLQAYSYYYTYDSLQQWTDVDTCVATYCETIFQDSTSCDLQAWFTTGTNPNGVPTYTAQYSGGGIQPQYLWSVNGNYVGNNQPTYSAQLPAGTQLCLEVWTYSYAYDSLQQWTDVDTCFAYYCETIPDDSMSCDLQAWYTYTTNPNGVTTFTSHYTGGGMQPQYLWSVNGNYVGSNQPTYSAQLPAGTQVCLEMWTYSYVYDSLQQWTDVDTCFAYYCAVVGGDSSGCDLQAWYSYEENPNGVLTFTAYYSGGGEQVQYFWNVNGSYAGGQQTLTGNYPDGTEVCLEVRTHYFTYDSLQQWTDVDTCFAYHCEVVGVAGVDEAPEIGFTLYPNPASAVISLKTDAEIVAVEIRDMNGRIVLVSDRKEGIDVSMLTQGVYCVRATDASGTVSPVERFIRE